MSENTQLDEINNELRNPATTAERVQQIFDGIIHQVNVKKVTLENDFYVVAGEFVQQRIVISPGILPPLTEQFPFNLFFRRHSTPIPMVTLYFPKAKLTKDQIIRLLEAANK